MATGGPLPNRFPREKDTMRKTLAAAGAVALLAVAGCSSGGDTDTADAQHTSCVRALDAAETVIDDAVSGLGIAADVIAQPLNATNTESATLQMKQLTTATVKDRARYDRLAKQCRGGESA